ncbi:MAG: protein-glutamate O-methyltransferase CheR [Rubrivivax sp.]
MNTITDTEFSQFQRFIFDTAGITLSPAKKALVTGRLGKRLQAHGLASFGDYFRLISSDRAGAEAQNAVDLLTTNETYFFREPKHFELLRRLAQEHQGRTQPFRIWSAASSTGEECYSMAMVLADVLGEAAWEVTGSDISLRVLQRARAGHYPMERARNIPQAYLKRFCLKGQGEQEGTLLVERALRQRVSFAQVNLNTELPRLGPFDVVFLRNVMIYFNGDTKRQVVARVLSLLKPGGYFCIGHSESLNDISTAVRQVAPSVYRKP